MEDDVLMKILQLLPAKSLAAAACVSRQWNAAGATVAKRPCIVSSISLRSNRGEAVKEVIAKVLEAPIRPQFAIVFASPSFSLVNVSNLLGREFPGDIPIIGCHAAGIMGVDAATNEFKEVFFYSRKSPGISLITGFLPGVSIECFSIPSLKKTTLSTISSCFSDSAPKSLILLAKRNPGLNEFFARLSEHFGSTGTPLISGGCCAGDLIAKCTPKPCSNESKVLKGRKRTIVSKKSLKSLRRGSKSPGSSRKDGVYHADDDLVGLSFIKTTSEAKLCLEVASVGGVIPVGPVYEIVRHENVGLSTRLFCRPKGSGSKSYEAPDFDVVSCRGVSSPSHYLVTWTNSKFVDVEGEALKPGDDILFYNVDRETALAERDEKLSFLSVQAEKMQQVMLSLVFACEAREQEFFEDAETDSHHLGARLPGKPRAGMFCTAEIGPHPGFGDTGVGIHSHTSIFTVFGWNSKQEKC